MGELAIPAVFSFKSFHKQRLEKPRLLVGSPLGRKERRAAFYSLVPRGQKRHASLDDTRPDPPRLRPARAAATPAAPLVVSPERRATVGGVDALARAAGRLLADAALAPGAVVGLAAAERAGLPRLAPRPAPSRARRPAPRRPDPGRRGPAHRPRPGRRRPPALPDRLAGGPRRTGNGRLWTTRPCHLHLPPDTAVVKLTSGSTGAAAGHRHRRPRRCWPTMRP